MDPRLPCRHRRSDGSVHCSTRSWLHYAKKSRETSIEINPIAIDRFKRLMRDQLTSGDAAARKAYLSTLVDAIIVSEDNVQIVGSNDNIRSTFEPDGQPTSRVRKSVQGWCAWRDSNSCSRFVVQILSGRFALQSQYRSPRDVRPLISKDMVRPPVTGSAPSSFRKSKAVPAV